MEQKHILLSALSVGVGVGVGLGVNKWSSGGGGDEGVTAAQIEYELFRLIVDGKDEKDTLKDFPYYLRLKTLSYIVYFIDYCLTFSLLWFLVVVDFTFWFQIYAVV